MEGKTIEGKTIKNSLILLLVACIWGCAFVAQSVGGAYLGPFAFNGSRFIIGGTVLLPFLLYGKKKEGTQENIGRKEKKENRKVLWTGGICCGLVLCSASYLQQIGVSYTSAGKAGFITALYIIIVPIFGIFLRQRTGKKIWAGAILAVFGFYQLCGTQSFSIGKGEIFLFLCAMLFAVHILVIDYFSPKTNGVAMSCIQFYVSGAISLVGMLLTEHPTMEGMKGAALAVLYAGVLSCGAGYTLQIIGQRGMNPTIASLIMSLESVISVLAGWVILGQTLSRKELLGCIIVFVAVILVQLPEKSSADSGVGK